MVTRQEQEAAIERVFNAARSDWRAEPWARKMFAPRPNVLDVDGLIEVGGRASGACADRLLAIVLSLPKELLEGIVSERGKTLLQELGELVVLLRAEGTYFAQAGGAATRIFDPASYGNIFERLG